jgi:mono/diheme cytochrome c family protein
MTYLGRDGKQYVVVAAGGTNRLRMIANTADKNSDALIAFALPNRPQATVSQNSYSPPAATASGLSQSDPGEANAKAVISATTASSGAAANAAATAALPEGEGKAIVLSVCTKCHGPTNFSTLRMSRSAWEDEVEDMKDRGAIGTDDDFKKIVDYLAKNFPPRK